MTTTAAATSASSNTPNDSHSIQNDSGASQPIIESQQQSQKPQYQNHSDEQSLSSPPTPQSQNTLQEQRPVVTTTTNTTTTSTSPTTATTKLSSSSSSASSSSSSDTTEISATKQQSPPNVNVGTNNTEQQKRPMNAFLLFCKRQRSFVREKHPNLENRGITKILGEWWSKLDKEQKSKYNDLARQHKEAFMKANPDFKWCKTPNVNNVIVNNNNSSNSTSNSNDCHKNNPINNNHSQLMHKHPHSASSTSAELLALQSAHHMEVMHHTSSGMDITLTNRQQLAAPKPPKKRFLERNDSIYTTKNSFKPNHHDTNSHSTDVVPYISLDQDTLDRVIDKAFSEDSSNSPSGVNTCKCSNRTTANSTTSLGTTLPFTSSTPAYSTNADEPVDFSMNRTINATRQQIINNLVEKMLSEPTDNAKVNGMDSARGQAGPPVRRNNTDDT